MWNIEAEHFSNSYYQSVIILQNVKIAVYNDKLSLTVVRETSIFDNPDIPETQMLKDWYEKQNSQICLEPAVSEVSQDLIRLNEINIQPLSKSITVAAIILNCSNMKSYIKQSTNVEIFKREVTLVDSSETAITLTLWNSTAKDFDGKKGDVLVLQNASIKEHQNRRSISHSAETIILTNPENQLKIELVDWFNSVGEKIMINKIINMALSNDI